MGAWETALNKCPEILQINFQREAVPEIMKNGIFDELNSNGWRNFARQKIFWKII